MVITNHPLPMATVKNRPVRQPWNTAAERPSEAPLCAGFRRASRSHAIRERAIQGLPQAYCRQCRKSTPRSAQAWRGDECARRGASDVQGRCPSAIPSALAPSRPALLLQARPVGGSRQQESRPEAACGGSVVDWFTGGTVGPGPRRNSGRSSQCRSIGNLPDPRQPGWYPSQRTDPECGRRPHKSSPAAA